MQPLVRGEVNTTNATNATNITNATDANSTTSTPVSNTTIAPTTTAPANTTTTTLAPVYTTTTLAPVYTTTTSLPVNATANRTRVVAPSPLYTSAAPAIDDGFPAPAPVSKSNVAFAEHDNILVGLPFAVFGCIVVLCLAAALYTYGKRLMSGLPRKKSLVFHKIDDVDEAGVELSSSFDEHQRREDEFCEERKDDVSSMRTSVLTVMT